jgi:hypothetical protein
MPESVRYGNKVTQSGTGILRYRTEMMDAGIAMSAASALMLMPTSYEVQLCNIRLFCPYNLFRFIYCDIYPLHAPSYSLLHKGKSKRLSVIFLSISLLPF